MHQSRAKQTNRANRNDTAFVGELRGSAIPRAALHSMIQRSARAGDAAGPQLAESSTITPKTGGRLQADDAGEGAARFVHFVAEAQPDSHNELSSCRIAG